MIDMNKYYQGMVAVCEGCTAYHRFEGKWNAKAMKTDSQAEVYDNNRIQGKFAKNKDGGELCQLTAQKSAIL